jgi:hypothetical protein
MDNGEIKKSWWKYGSGHHIRDRLEFNDKNLIGDTIYSNDEPVAIIISCARGMFQNSAELKIKDLTTGELGTYYEK